MLYGTRQIMKKSEDKSLQLFKASGYYNFNEIFTPCIILPVV